MLVQRLEQLVQELSAAHELLMWSGQQDEVLRGWVRRQLVEEALQHEWFTLAPDSDERELCPPVALCFAQSLLQQDEALLAWADHMWGQGLNLYLARKSQLDHVTLRLLRVADGGLAMSSITASRLAKPHLSNFLGSTARAMNVREQV